MRRHLRSGQAVRLRYMRPIAARSCQLKGAERHALSGPAPPASKAPTLDPGASASPAGLTARARPTARPDERAANLGGIR
jgi:hypothetical protein